MLNNYRHIGINFIGEQRPSTVTSASDNNALYYKS